MKRFGVQIAAGATTILLGALAAAQAQKDSSGTNESDWDVPDQTEMRAPTTAIAMADLQPIDGPSTANDATTSPWSGGNVMQVAHNEPVDPASQDGGNASAAGFNVSFDPAGAEIADTPAADVQDAARSLAQGAASMFSVSPPTFAESDTDPEASAASDLAAEATASAAEAFSQPAAEDFPEPPAGGFPEPAAGTGLQMPTLGDFQPAEVAGSPGDFVPEPAAASMAAGDASPVPEPMEMAAPPTADPAQVGGFAADASAYGSFAPAGDFADPQSVPPSNGLREAAADASQLQPLPAMAAASQDAAPEDTAPQPQAFDAQPQGFADSGAGSFADAAATPSPEPSSASPPGNGLMQSEPPTFAQQSPAQQTPAQPSSAAAAYDAATAASQADSYAANAGGAAMGFGANNAAPTSYDLPAQTSNMSAPPTQSAGNGYGMPASAQMRNQNPPAAGGFNASSLPTDSAQVAAGTPGDRRFDGVQTPSVVIHKRAPAEVRVGQPASFSITVRNVGSVEALDVRVHDQVPQGMELVDAMPGPTMSGDGRLLWQLGSLEPGGEQTITLQLMPRQEGELGSVARVTFEAAASVRTRSTCPQLEIVQRAPQQVLIGQQVEIELEVSNPGSGAAENIIIQEDVPEQLQHRNGRQLDNRIGVLQPGETRRELLRMTAVKPGMVRNLVRVRGDNGLEAQHAVDLQVIAPQLQVTLNGPKLRFLERQATYNIRLANAGTADAHNVQLVAQLDRGFQFVSTINQGQYDPNRHAVIWSLAQLPAGEEGEIELTLLPIEEGEQALRLEAASDLSEAVVEQSVVSVQSLAELTFQIADTADPIEQAGETTYEIRVTNTGSRDDANVQVQLQIPRGMQLIAAEGDAQSDNNGNVFFNKIPRLDAGQEQVYRVKVRGLQAGRHLIKAIVVSDQSSVPVTKEESTMVYADR
ncbi:DUF11 domain-containing protein [Crateriforma conspicua]|uniref:Large cysteine-rich periplasmic protein OmcB n=1 Tax=Crateriforma conspicua TaxID=2527996 RepID=A0A5C5Y453_9PLAN|nr:DUF11 domain-containing protein [Crateriforma conspicua]TWT69411.1 Large cysteine-rich periplasmic protein OmcB precursor [Crateriforma conspicua]